MARRNHFQTKNGPAEPFSNQKRLGRTIFKPKARQNHFQTKKHGLKPVSNQKWKIAKNTGTQAFFAPGRGQKIHKLGIQSSAASPPEISPFRALNAKAFPVVIGGFVRGGGGV